MAAPSALVLLHTILRHYIFVVLSFNSFFTVSKILVSTGDPRDPSVRTEIINLENNEVNCPDLGDYPLDIHYAVGSYIGSYPVICGGGDGSASFNQCYRLVAGVWQEFATMTSNRQRSAGIAYANSFMIFGGNDWWGHGGGGSSLQSTEIISETGQVSQGPDLPVTLDQHAIAALNSSVSIISGGSSSNFYGSPETWYYNHITQDFQSGPSLIQGRLNHASGLIVDHETNENIVVIAGGYGIPGCGVFKGGIQN